LAWRARKLLIIIIEFKLLYQFFCKLTSLIYPCHHLSVEKFGQKWTSRSDEDSVEDSEAPGGERKHEKNTKKTRQKHDIFPTKPLQHPYKNTTKTRQKHDQINCQKPPWRNFLFFFSPAGSGHFP